jgi:putative membrane protein
VIALAAALAVAFAYAYAVRIYRRRLPQRAFPLTRSTAFYAGTALMAIALSPAMDVRADTSFAMHMLQHLLLAFAAPPLLLLGAPLLLLVTVLPRAGARRITALASSRAGRILFAPLTGFLAFVFVLWGTHFSPLYELALERPGVHAIEHALFFGSAMLFWSAVVQVGYAPHPVPFPARMLFLFLAIPQGAFVAFALAASRTALYPHYVHTLGAAALADQRAGADLMWILGGFLLFAAFMCEAGAWAVAERRAPA